MTVVAAEAIPAVESAAPAAASTAASRGSIGKQAARQRQHAQASEARRAGASSPIDAPAPARQRPERPGRSGQAQAREAVYATPEGETRTVQLPDASIPEHTWHRWIMAEFVLAVILVGASPFLKPGGPAAKAPSFAAPLVRLTAVSLIYFILALMAQGPRSGKIAAAFGGLVLLGTAFNSLPEFTTLGQAFGSSGPPGTQTGLKAGETDETGGGSGGREMPQ